jgi:3-deoxy-manno-octulosonate cytidylyltransferase (CMP-KDO synthetase)
MLNSIQESSTQNSKPERFNVFIPVRLESKRLKEKALKIINGKEMIVRTYEQSLKSKADNVYIVTDSIMIADAIRCYYPKANIIMNELAHFNGTSRICEAVYLLNLNNNEIVVNVQGDNPFINPLAIDEIASTVTNQYKMGTLCKRIDFSNPEDVRIFTSEDHAKVIRNCFKEAIYFSRHAIPYNKNSINDICYYRHIGLYAYRVSLLKEYVQVECSPLELSEDLEQLRAIYYGVRIHCVETKLDIVSDINTMEDLNILNFKKGN